MKKIARITIEQAQQRIHTILRQAGLDNVLLLATGPRGQKNGDDKVGFTFLWGDKNELAVYMVGLCHEDEAYREDLLPVLHAVLHHGSGACRCVKCKGAMDAPTSWQIKKLNDFLEGEGATDYLVCVTTESGGWVTIHGDKYQLVKTFANAISEDKDRNLVPLFATAIEAGMGCKVAFTAPDDPESRAG